MSDQDNSWVEITPFQLAMIAAQERFKCEPDDKQALKNAYSFWVESVREMAKQVAVAKLKGKIK